ncbi:tetratricopeptide repeat protein [Diaphorobacter sp. HDW4A]|uniref:tetratricopeptide repeat protein n=1 Tax=Diaphorobacter sp. HDW4A TaxID=2714924 RepID=UPI00140BE318|nr:tetratricopeptide repeat protein [Diaphorobacter sp. HDW4A]QIL82059.1 tetratricopeptide repeat protein [Diaphorobacter sp. HDW4A]
MNALPQHFIEDFLAADNHDDWRAAIEVAGQAVTQCPGIAQAFAMRARAHWRLGEIDACDSDIAHALQLDPRCALAIATQAARMDDEGQTRQAMATLDEAIRALPGDARLHIARGWIHQENDHANQALLDYRQAIALDPQNMRGYVNAAALLDSMGRNGEAADLWHNGALSCGDNGQLAYNAGTALYQQKDYERAIVHLDRARQIIGERNDVQMNRAQTLQMLGRHQEAVDEWLLLYRREPHWDWVLNGLVESCYRLGDNANAQRFRWELDQLSRDHEGTVKLGWLLFHDRKSEELIELVEPLAKDAHARPEFGQMMGMSLRRQEKYPEALQWMERNVATHDDYHWARGDLANLLSEIYGRHDEALKHIQIALSMSPESTFYRRVHGEILERKNGGSTRKGGWLKRLFGG